MLIDLIVGVVALWLAIHSVLAVLRIRYPRWHAAHVNANANGIEAETSGRGYVSVGGLALDGGPGERDEEGGGGGGAGGGGTGDGRRVTIRTTASSSAPSGMTRNVNVHEENDATAFAVTVRAASLRVTTTRVNHAFSRLLRLHLNNTHTTTTHAHNRLNMSYNTNSTSRVALVEVWFALGAAFGVMALVASCLFVLASCARAFLDVLTLGYSAQRSVQVTLAATHSLIPANTSSANASLFSVSPPWWHPPDALTPQRSYSSFTYSSGENLESPNHGKLLVSLIPGVNLPFYALGYYFIALLMAAVFHEAGHALAAAYERVPIQTVGLFLEVIYPGAFVQLSSTALSHLRPSRRLRIVCAGVWHNAVLATACWCALYTLPRWLAWGYRDLARDGGAVVVLGIVPESPLVAGLKVGNLVVGVDDVRVGARGVFDWDDGLVRSLRDGSDIVRQGYCVERRVVSTSANDTPCCNVNNVLPLGDSSNTLQCFLPRDQVNYRPTIELAQDKLLAAPKACLTLDTVVRHGSHCTLDSDCSARGTCMAAYIPQENIRVVRIQVVDLDVPAASGGVVRRSGEESVATAEGAAVTGLDGPVFGRTMHEGYEAGALVRPGGRRKVGLPVRTVLYLGDPREISEAVRVGALYPKYTFLPINLPFIAERMLHFLIAFNAALSLINMVPARDMDGYLAASALMDWYIESQVDRSRPDFSSRTRIGTAKLRRLKDRILHVVGIACAILL
ncbi:hypothetical protein BC830DRAFT_1219127, partial [Chytriomyces sp. MP71]